MDLGERASKQVRGNLPEFPNTTFMVVIHWVLNGNNIVLSPNKLQASYTDVTHWEELIDSIKKNGGPKEPYVSTSRFKCTVEQNKLDKEFMGLYTNERMIMDPIHGQISYNCCLSNNFKLKHEYNLKRFVIEKKCAKGKVITEHRIRPAKVISASPDKSRCTQLVIIIHRLWKTLKRLEESRERRMVGKRMILVLM